MARLPLIYLTQYDFNRLTDRLEAYGAGGRRFGQREDELARARTVPPDEIPPDVVAMNSRVSCLKMRQPVGAEK